MPNRLQIAAGIVATAVAYDLVTRPLRTKFNTLTQLYTEKCQQVNSLNEQMAYLIHVCNENGIVLDDFDLIALPNVTKS